MSNIVVATMNGNVHCNMYGVKTTIKKVGFLRASIAPTIGNHVPFTIEGKWFEAMVGMSKADFFVQPHPKQVQLLIKTKLQGKF
jgi:hypothetical protein